LRHEATTHTKPLHLAFAKLVFENIYINFSASRQMEEKKNHTREERLTDATQQSRCGKPAVPYWDFVPSYLPTYPGRSSLARRNFK
jgi:hypothetical protein